MSVSHFKTSCFYDHPSVVVQKYLIDGSTYFFDTFFSGKDEEFNFKKDLAISLGVHIREIAIIGSGKLGFSIKPDESNLAFYPFKEFDNDFKLNSKNKKSDLDIAIISSELFEKQLLSIYNHTDSYRSQTYQGSSKKSFAFYVLKGWLNLEFIPRDYVISPNVQKFEEKYKSKYDREINIGVYKTWFYFENYHNNNIRNLKLNLIAS